MTEYFQLRHLDWPSPAISGVAIWEGRSWSVSLILSDGRVVGAGIGGHEVREVSEVFSLDLIDQLLTATKEVMAVGRSSDAAPLFVAWDAPEREWAVRSVGRGVEILSVTGLGAREAAEEAFHALGDVDIVSRTPAGEWRVVRAAR